MANIPINLQLKATERISAALNRAGSAVTDLKGKLAGAQRGFDAFRKSTEESRKRLEKIGSGMRSIGGKMTAAITLPVTAGLAGSLKVFSDYEHQMTGVKTLLDDDTFKGKTVIQGFADMKKAAKAVAVSVPVDIASLNKALFETVSAGVDASKSVVFVNQAAKLAVSGLTDVATATDGMTNALNAFSLDANDAEKIAAKFFVAQKRGKTTIEELSSDIGKVASTANALGVSLEEVLASTAAATSGAIKTNEAFTSMKAVFSNIIKPTQQATELAKGLGVGFDSMTLRKKGIVNFLDDIIKATKRVGGDPRRAFELLFGSTEALNFALAITGSQAGLFKKTLAELQDETGAVTTFQKAFAEQSSTTSSKMTVLKNKLSILGIEIGERLAPHLIKVTDRLGRLFDLVATSPGLQKAIIGFGLFAAAMGPVIIALGTFITFIPVIQMFAAGLSVIAPVLLAIGAAWLPLLGIGLIFAGTAAAIWKNWDGIVDIFTNFEDVIEGIKITIKEGLVSAFETLLPIMKKVSGIFDVIAGPLASFAGGAFDFMFTKKDQKPQTGITGGFPNVIPFDFRKAPEFGADPFGKVASLGPDKSIAPKALPTTNTTESKVQIEFKNAPEGMKVNGIKGSSDSLIINSGMQGAFGT